ncbi:zinc metalloprotease [Aquirufa sp. Wall-65K1]
MSYLLNPDFKLIYQKESSEDLFFKHSWKDCLIQISQLEWEILSHLVKHRDQHKTLAYLRQSYEADNNILHQLIEYSLEIELLIPEESYEAYLNQKHQKIKQGISTWKMGVIKLFSLLSIPIEFIGSGNLRFYKIAKIPLENTWIEVLAKNSIFQYAFISLNIILFTMGIYPIVNNAQFLQQWLSFELWGESSMLLPFLIVGLLVTSFLHELAHYTTYLRYGGMVADLGFSWVLGFIPFIHITTNSLHFWENNTHKRIVILAGILLDLSLFLGINFILNLNLDKVWLSHWQFIQGFIAFRVLFNSIPFIPGTDGYFLVSDWLKEPALFHEASRSFQKFKSTIFQREAKVLLTKDYIYLAYILMSYCFITAYYCLLALWIILPYFISILP